MIKKILAGFILVSAVFLTEYAWAGVQPTITFYYSSHCNHCLKIKQEVVPVIQKKYNNKVRIVMKNTGQENAMGEFLDLCRQYKMEAYVPAFYTVLSDEEKYLLIGSDKIEDNIFTLLDAFFAKSQNASSQGVAASADVAQSENDPLIERFKSFSFWAILGAGLIDGINPCAFAVIILFISFLSVYGYSRRQMVLIGSCYILAVFITYFLIGMGLFNFLYSLNIFYYFIKLFYVLIIVLCFALAGFSFYDYMVIRKTGQADGALLQLPAAIKKRIQLIFAKEYRHRGQKTFFLQMAAGAFTVGVAVSLLEAVCTGQVYVPTIALIMKVSHLRAKALGYLFFYNSMFITPLVFIFILALAGVSSLKMSEFLKKHLGMIKIFLTILFLGLGVFILLTEFF